MRLYISYYGSYISVVEGMYNRKKDKYIIKNSTILSSEDLEIDDNDKYGLLKEALRLNKFKSKNVVFSLNTRDIIIKSNQIPKASPKDLDGIMNNEMYEIMSLDEEQYTFSYEVTKETTIEDKELLEVVIAAISNDELDIIIDIFNGFNLKVERIDTISTAYNRLLKKIEYDDIMMLNIGSYGSIVSIYKEDTLFINDKIPVRINEKTNYAVCLALIDEVKGLMNFYSSRNFGKNIDTIVLLGQSNENKDVNSGFKESFESDIVIGIENLFDIKDDIQGDLQENEISKVCEVLGSMLVDKNKKSYSCMNLIPTDLKQRQKNLNVIKKYAAVAPILLVIMLIPYLVFEVMTMKIKNEIDTAQAELSKIQSEYKGIEDINDRISKAQEEIKIYDMLSSKDVKWGTILDAIERNIPYRADLTNLDIYYDNSLVEVKEESAKEDTKHNDEKSTKNNETKETPIYDKIPNVISIDGIASKPAYVGQFVYNLNQLGYFESVDLSYSIANEEDGVYDFNIVSVLKEGVVSNE